MPDINTSSGVDYNALDAFKRLAQETARTTDGYAHRLGIIPFSPSRGESAFLLQYGDHYLAFVDEGLGTKLLVADAMEIITGRCFYHHIAQDTIAMAVNDMITVGALPFVVSMHLAVGDSGWFNNRLRVNKLITGWQAACELAGCIWGPGETPELRDIIRSGAAVLSGSAIGRTPRLDWFDPSRIRNGDAIVFCESSGVHANGLTKAREISEKLLHGYQTTVPSLVNETYGEILLHPTHIYTPVVRVCYENSIDIHYAVNVTGHGWRKLMRPHQPFRYVVNSVPFRSPVFDFIQEHGGLTDEEMYASYNMGAGFALYMPKTSAQRLIEEAKQNLWPFRIFEAGHVEIAKKKHVVIESEGIVFQADSLRVR